MTGRIIEHQDLGRDHLVTFVSDDGRTSHGSGPSYTAAIADAVRRAKRMPLPDNNPGHGRKERTRT